MSSNANAFLSSPCAEFQNERCYFSKWNIPVPGDRSGIGGMRNWESKVVVLSYRDSSVSKYYTVVEKASAQSSQVEEMGREPSKSADVVGISILQHPPPS